jgi:hypothetical protein
MDMGPPFETPLGAAPDLPSAPAPDVSSGGLPQVPVSELAAGIPGDGAAEAGPPIPDITAPPDRVAPPTAAAELTDKADGTAGHAAMAEPIGSSATAAAVEGQRVSREHIRAVAADSDQPRRYIDVPIDGAVQRPEAPDPAEVVEAMDQHGLAEHFGSPGAAKETLRSMNTDEFHAAANRANGIVRGLPPEQHGYAPEGYLTEARNETTGRTSLSPLGPDRRTLIGEGFEAAQQLDDLERAGTLMNTVTREVHAWEDANGRMARAGQELLHRGYNGSDADRDYYRRLLTNHEGRHLVNTSDVAELQPRFNNAVTRGIVDAAGQGQFMPDGGVIPIDRDALGIAGLPPGDLRRDLADMAEEPHFGATLVTAVAVQTGRDLYDYVLQHPRTGKQYFDAGRLIGDVYDSEAGLIRDAYGMIKRQFVRSVIDCLGPRGDQSLYGPPELVVAKYRSREYQGRWQ